MRDTSSKSGDICLLSLQTMENLLWVQEQLLSLEKHHFQISARLFWADRVDRTVGPKRQSQVINHRRLPGEEGGL